ncbi:MAG TPA: NAD(P)/FAD-dependent oxidoreductase, partial [Thiolapillus brandeum]|nr:NAD(P)/FAD-dependent oxidoreductase [Thiolapillus brandeum]
MQYVIIGAGPAGIIAAETLRKEAPESTITIVGKEPEPPYSRMAIPYYLTNKVGEEGTWLRPDAEHFKALGIDIVQ